MIAKELLEILVCPETKQPLEIAPASLIAQLNERICQGTLKNRAGSLIRKPLQDGLVRTDKLVFYAIQDGIPIMLIDEGIVLADSDRRE